MNRLTVNRIRHGIRLEVLYGANPRLVEWLEWDLREGACYAARSLQCLDVGIVKG